MQLLTTLLSALALAASTTAEPIPVAKRSELIVVSPPITSPRAGDMWPVGSSQIVTWDTSSIPQSGKNNTGTIVLGYNDGTGSENLDIGKPPRPAHGGTTPTLPQTTHLQLVSSLRSVASR